VRILGISSATKILGVALVDDEKILAEYSVTGEQAKTENLIIFIEEVLKKAGFELKDVEGLAVTQGPGSYGGLRGGLQTAKTLAQVLKIPVVGISTLEAVAYNLESVEGTILAVTDASRDDFNLALFGTSAGKLRRLTEDAVANMDQIVKLLSQVKGTIYLTGIISDISAKLQMTNIKMVESLPLPVNVAKLGLKKIRVGEVDDYLILMPYYSEKLGIKEWKSNA